MASGKFKAGKSGNPKGRPKGSKDKRTALRELLQPHAEDLVKKAVELAKAGDVTALRMCLDRLIPPYRAKDATVAMGEPKGTLTEQGQKAIAAMIRGELAPVDTVSMLKLEKLFKPDIGARYPCTCETVTKEMTPRQPHRPISAQSNVKGIHCRQSRKIKSR